MLSATMARGVGMRVASPAVWLAGRSRIDRSGIPPLAFKSLELGEELIGPPLIRNQEWKANVARVKDAA